MDASTFIPERFIFSGYYDQPIFSVPRQVKSHAYWDSDEEGDLLRNNGDAHRATSPSISILTSTSRVSEKWSTTSIVTQFLSKKAKIGYQEDNKVQ